METLVLGSSDQVLANAGLALRICYPDLSLEDCMAKARESIESGSAYHAFKTLMELSQ